MTLEKETEKLINEFIIPNKDKKIVCYCPKNKFRIAVGYCRFLNKLIITNTKYPIEVKKSKNLASNDDIYFVIDKEEFLFELYPPKDKTINNHTINIETIYQPNIKF